MWENLNRFESFSLPCQKIGLEMKEKSQIKEKKWHSFEWIRRLEESRSYVFSIKFQVRHSSVASFLQQKLQSILSISKFVIFCWRSKLQFSLKLRILNSFHIPNCYWPPRKVLFESRISAYYPKIMKVGRDNLGLNFSTRKTRNKIYTVKFLDSSGQIIKPQNSLKWEPRSWVSIIEK